MDVVFTILVAMKNTQNHTKKTLYGGRDFQPVHIKFRYIGLGSILFLLVTLNPLTAVAIDQQERALSFYNTHTGERVTVIYKRQGRYVNESQEKVNYILRDHRSGDVHPIDPKLMDYLFDLLTEVGNHGEVHVISGYRSPDTNRKLRQRGKGVAKKSLHMQGKALDFRLPGTDTAVLRKAARKMKRGGVGYYRKSDFIQIDTGRVRYW